MKKVLTIILAIMMFTLACVGVSAETHTHNSIHIDNVEVIFEENSTLSDAAKQHIAEQLVYGNAPIQTYGLTCTLFGHKTTTETVITISHCVYPTAPRCVRETWEVTSCSRCDYMEKTLLKSALIQCCP